MARNPKIAEIIIPKAANPRIKLFSEYSPRDRKIANSPQKFPKPGNPMVAKVAAAKKQARIGVFMANPPISSISSVLVRSLIKPATKYAPTY